MTRRVALRPRKDHYRLPRFPELRERPMRPEPFDGGSWETYAPDPQPLEWRELVNPSLWRDAGLVAALGVIALIVFLSSGPVPS